MAAPLIQASWDLSVTAYLLGKSRQADKTRP